MQLKDLVGTFLASIFVVLIYKLKSSNMTHKDQFFNYLVALNLFRWAIMETEDEFLACVSPESNPNVSDFTQVYQNKDGSWSVRLSKSDIYNEAITKGFFR